MVKLKQEQI